MAFGAIAGAAASAATSFGLSKLFGGGKKETPLPQPSFGIPARATGLQATFNRRGELATELRGLGQREAGQLRGLRPLVAPGVSRLREARLGRIRDAAARATGNLRENLAQRRIAGSRFGLDALSSAEAEFARLESDVEAETTLDELRLTTDLIGREFQAERSGLVAEIDALGLPAEVATRFGLQADKIAAENARFKMEMAAKEAEGRGEFIGQITQPFASALGRGVTGLFGGRDRTRGRTTTEAGLIGRI